MSRLLSVKPVIFAALGAAVFFSFPIAANAAASAGAGSNGITVYHTYTGLDYPDTAVGLADCQEMGSEILLSPAAHAKAYSCDLGDPDAGVYGLWITQVVVTGE